MPRISLLYCLVLLGSRYVFASYKLPRLGFLRLLGTLPSDSGSEGLPRQINRKSLRPRDDTVVTISTCGFLTGDPTKPRTAEVGYACRVDTENALWGFCPESVIQASDCGLAGACQDSHGCESICGIFGVADITTVSCTKWGVGFCSVALLTAGPDQTYSYYACGQEAKTENLLASTTPDSVASTMSATPSKRPRPSITFPPSTSPGIPSITTGSMFTSIVVSSAGTLPRNTNVPEAPATSATNTGAIVGGVMGGLAFLCFIVFAILVLRRLKSLRTDTMPAVPSFWHSDRRKREATTDYQSGRVDPQREWHNPIELSAEARPIQISGGRQHETPELYYQGSEARRD